MAYILGRGKGDSGGGGGAPSGPAGGALSGTYPNPTLSAANQTGYGTSLPGSPVDGQQYILVDSTTNPAYQWRFRYNAGSSSAYKWEFVGGAPWTTSSESSTTVTSVGFADFASVLSLTTPLAGDWICGASAGFMQQVTGSAREIYTSVYADGQEVYAVDLLTVPSGNGMSGGREHRFNALAASSVVKMRGGSSSGLMTVNNREVSLLPVRVA